MYLHDRRKSTDEFDSSNSVGQIREQESMSRPICTVDMLNRRVLNTTNNIETCRLFARRSFVRVENASARSSTNNNWMSFDHCRAASVSFLDIFKLISSRGNQSIHSCSITLSTRFRSDSWTLKNIIVLESFLSTSINVIEHFNENHIWRRMSFFSNGNNWHDPSTGLSQSSMLLLLSIRVRITFSCK
jgi:hypothetical protein